jgi:hypothetical protein
VLSSEVPSNLSTFLAAGIISGKWMLFRPDPDYAWSKVVEAMADENGLLRGTTVHTAKVATAAEGDRGYVICIYVDDSYDRDAVKAALDIINGEGMDLNTVRFAFRSKNKASYLRSLAQNSFKPDVLTFAGVTSKTGAPFKASLYTPGSFYTKEELAAQKAAQTARWEEKKAPPKKRSADEEAAQVKASGGGFEDDSATEDEEEEKPKPAKKVKRS